MLSNYNKYKVLKVFFDDPLPKTGFQLREISRKISLAPKSVSRYLKELEKEGFVREEKHRVNKYPLYYANRDSDIFKLYKKIDMLISIEECGVVEHLNDKCTPDVIILFGSASRGEDIAESDVDLFLQSKQKDIDLKHFERKINRKINVFFSEHFNKLSNELKNNIANGIKLRGYLKIF